MGVHGWTLALLLGVVAGCAQQNNAPNHGTGAGGGPTALDEAPAPRSAQGHGEAVAAPHDAEPVPAALGAACATFGGGSGEREAQVGALQRRWLQYVPAAGAQGVLFLWHGYGDNADNMARAWSAQRFADTTRWAVIVPRAIDPAFPTWDWSDDEATRNDVMLFDALSACRAAVFGDRTQSVAASGFSDGGFMTTWLAMHRAQTLDLAVILSGGLRPGMLSWHAPEAPVRVALYHGGDTDTYADRVHFGQTNALMRQALVAANVPTMECVHALGHTYGRAAVSLTAQWLRDTSAAAEAATQGAWSSTRTALESDGSCAVVWPESP